MKLEFDGLDLENFGVFSTTQTLDLRKRGPGLHFLRGRNEIDPQLGSNNSGKTTLLGALCWCLFGKTAHNLRNTDIEPWTGKKNSRVRVYLQTDYATHSITRTTHPNQLQIDGQEVGQEQVEALIGMNWHIFTHTVLMGQKRPLFFDLTPKDKMDLFTDALNLERWEQRSALASSKVGELEMDKAQINGELLSTEALQGQLEGLLKDVRQRAASWEHTNQIEKDDLTKQVAKIKVRFEQAQDQLAKAELAYDGAVTEAKPRLKEIEKLEKALADANREYDRANNKVDNLRGERLKLSNERKGAPGKRSTICPTCGQSLKGTALQKHQDEIDKRIKALDAEIDLGPPKAVVDKAKRASNNLYNCKEQQKAFFKKAEEAHDTKDTMTPIVARLEAEASSLNKTLAQKEKEKNPHMGQVAQLKKQKAELEVLIKALTTKKDKLDVHIERTRFWVKGFKEVRLYIIEEVLQELEITTNAVLEDVGLVGWAVEYAIEKETKSGTIQRGLNVSILSPHNENPVRWEVWSGGVGQRLRIVGALALSEVLLNHAGVQTNLEILDEPTTSLSMEGVRDLCDFLASRAKQLEHQTWYVDHMAIESSQFASTLTVVRTDKGARLE